MSEWIISTAGGLTFFYAVFVFLQWYGWMKTKRFHIPDHYHPSTKISVIIPARNEEKNIPSLLEGLLQQDYPEHLLEIILVDDDSSDHTLQLAQKYISRIKIISSQNPEDTLHKKKSLEQGIARASGELIITTDADCTHPPQWLKTIACYHEHHHPALMLCPVIFRDTFSSIHHFQQLEFSAIMLTTASSVYFRRPLMANGANMAYPKKVFTEINGYSADTIASGDDISLLGKVRKKYGNNSVHFIKSGNVMVETEPVNTWKELIRQRTRWASKNFVNRDLLSLLTGGFIVLYTLCLLASCLLLFVNAALFYVPLYLFIFKMLADTLLFFTWSRFTGKSRSLIYILWAELLYIPYLFAVLLRSMAGSYEWKDRTIKK